MAKFEPGEIVEARSETQGWVRSKIVGEYGLTGYMVQFTEGKHAGEVIKLPDNYLRQAPAGPHWSPEPTPKYHEYMGYSGEYDAQGNQRMGPMAPDRPSGTCSCGRPITTKGMKTCGRRECIERLHK